jgi:signal transduction histidine kinase
MSATFPTAAAAGAELPPVRRSLRTKGLLATLALLAYVLGASAYIAIERGKIYEAMDALDRAGQHEKALALTEAVINSAMIEATVAGSAGFTEPASPAEVRLDLEQGGKLFTSLQEFDVAYALPYRSIERAFAALVASPDRANWIGLREALRRAGDELDIRHRRLVQERDHLVATYRRYYDAVTVESLVLAAFGLALFGSLAAWFFTRLAQDVRRLEAHALAIVQGERGVQMATRRDDELGRLIHAVNRMGQDLDEREQHMRVDAQRQAHQQKMLTVGALAAGVAHEVNNPLMVISGAAQELKDARTLEPQRVAEGATLIVAQAERAAQAARKIAEVAAPQPEDLDWLDLNAQLRHIVQLMGYDRRYRRFAFDLAADASLPAMRGFPNAVQQVLMQLLSLVCDAHGQGNGARVALATTRLGAEEASVSMGFDAVLDFARAEVQRSLLLTRAVVEPMRGRLAFDQTEGAGQRIRLILPMDASAPSA